jgi:hypothetical protein
MSMTPGELGQLAGRAEARERERGDVVDFEIGYWDARLVRGTWEYELEVYLESGHTVSAVGTGETRYAAHEAAMDSICTRIEMLADVIRAELEEIDND